MSTGACYSLSPTRFGSRENFRLVWRASLAIWNDRTLHHLQRQSETILTEGEGLHSVSWAACIFADYFIVISCFHAVHMIRS